ncbi:signal transduction histidine-protein kinase/phosphatase DegS [Halobacillus andaensis]|uniref:Signal transduction histidine-protein kinase/phosphatase DegS n=1 Tax=Halobacillus andaensis TaxID=1176239 RepID=A0A917EYL3_HALAA|nr:sensor histidine kinase [Halobacillus andaensis]MBP2005403.1 two-component system sensor histidine kinase DegS [Halobacillus andaensis]GGF31200.1 signal transduction histidine-protein kinase/phosphatase DegS [Halobacillus andaensis]
MKSGNKALDYIIKDMVSTVSNSKDEIFQIGEDSRVEFEKLDEELESIKEQVGNLIEDGDELERKVRSSRIRLSQVSKQFRQYSEEDIRKVYEQTHELQMDLSMTREKEKQLRERRDEIEIRLRNLDATIERAEALSGKISVVLNYLTEDFKNVTQTLETAKEKQEFGLQIIEAQEEERRRLSREIHDGPAQSLANVMLRSDLVERTFNERGIEEALLEMRNVRKLVRSALYDVRRIIYDLRPMALDDLGLVPTLKKYLATVEEYNQLHIHFASLGEERRLESKYEVAIFRLIQEAVQNAVKHSEASSIDVKFELRKEMTKVVIKDDGKGFDPTVKKEKSFGLMGMRERVDMVNGELHIQSSPGKGTIVTIHMPLNE